MESLALKLLSRGDELSIVNGQLQIEPASGKQVPSEWVDAHARQLCREVLTLIGLDAFDYQSYSTGHYGKTRSGGITIRFASVISGRPAYAIFNADLTRQRTTSAGKAGAALPKGQFRIGKRSHFYKFWLDTGLPFPRRLASLHDYMGRLRAILLTAQVSGDRINAGSLAPLNLSAAHFKAAVMPDNSRTIAGQVPNNSRTTEPDNEMSPALEERAFQPVPATCPDNYENKLTRRQVSKAMPSLPYKPPSEQTVDDWLEDYDNA